MLVTASQVCPQDSRSPTPLVPPKQGAQVAASCCVHICFDMDQHLLHQHDGILAVLKMTGPVCCRLDYGTQYIHIYTYVPKWDPNLGNYPYGGFPKFGDPNIDPKTLKVPP